ncbi:hypothetical protein A2V68_02860 [candidate division Kazan bacterium RBG_13_50_9]|uniref:Sortase n=1 Tax=candidate division Kazan bacterium RBG_13_50_9 TaxID=1798535 RepID=A0A1F4NSW3_UNCK3|nr:MAG: hypothetical protein A2V68_02860 [candidate division Kazan bacterium RBG_13_50_9]
MESQRYIIKVERPRGKVKAFFVELAKFLAIFLMFFAISSVFIMWPTLYAKIGYYLTASEISKRGTNLGLPVSSMDYASIAPVIDKRERVIPQDSRLVIPKIGVDVPIVFVDSTSNKDILEAIKDGVVHYADTAMPGRIGNMFVTGHSSYYWWRGGSYNQIFALLEHLQPNDLVYVYYQGGEYVYRVSGSMVVNPDQTEVLEPTPTPTLSLMTCTPIGTNLRRLIVKADLISTPPVDLEQLNRFAEIPRIPVILPL